MALAINPVKESLVCSLDRALGLFCSLVDHLRIVYFPTDQLKPREIVGGSCMSRLDRRRNLASRGTNTDREAKEWP